MGSGAALKEAKGRAVDASARRRWDATRAFPLVDEDNARRAALALLPVHRAWRWIVMRTAVDFASGASVAGRSRTTATNKKPRHSLE